MKTCWRAVGAALLLGASVSAPAHEGHVHADEPPPLEIRTAPRFEARGDLFEVVGVLEGDAFAVWVDRAGDNAPVLDGEVEIEAAGHAAKANAQGGVFRIAAGPLVAAGDHALTLTVTAGEDADLMTAVFHRAPDASAAASAGGSPNGAWIAGGLALAIVAFALGRMAGGRR